MNDPTENFWHDQPTLYGPRPRWSRIVIAAIERVALVVFGAAIGGLLVLWVAQ